MLSTGEAIFLLFCVAAYADLRLLVGRLHSRVSIWEHCHIKCKPDDSHIFEKG